jgi:hypothetical protein
VAAKCREARWIQFGIPPDGFTSGGGWWEGASGVVSGIIARSDETWTRAETESKLGTLNEIVRVVLPSGVSSISGDAFHGCTALRSLTVHRGCREIENGVPGHCGAMGGCVSLVNVVIPGTRAVVGRGAHWGC